MIDGSSSRVNIIATPNPAMGEAALDVVFTLHADDKRSKSSHISVFCLRFYQIHLNCVLCKLGCTLLYQNDLLARTLRWEIIESNGWQKA